MKGRFLHLTGRSKTSTRVGGEPHMYTEIARTTLRKIYKVISSKYYKQIKMEL